MPEMRGLCQNGYAPASLWLSEKPGPRARAAQICRKCPLLDPCHSWAITSFVITPGAPSVVGGVTESELKTEREQQGVPGPRVPILLGPPKPKTSEARARQFAKSHPRGANHASRPRPECPLC